MIKLNVRGSTIQYASRKKNSTDKYIKSLTNDINVLDLKCKENPNDDNLRSKLKEKEQILEHIYDERARGIYVRSKAQWVEDGEKSSKFFFSLEKNRSEKKVIQKLIVDGEEILEQDDILKEEARFYQNLYSPPASEDDQLDNAFLPSSLPKA